MKMAKKTSSVNPRVRQIFNDLDKYRRFCVEYGHVFNEAALYNQDNYEYRQFNKWLSGKPVRNNWEDFCRPVVEDTERKDA